MSLLPQDPIAPSFQAEKKKLPMPPKESVRVGQATGVQNLRAAKGLLAPAPTAHAAPLSVS